MGHYHGVNLLVCYWRLIPASIEAPGIDFPGDLLGFHAVARAGKEVYYSFL